MKHDRTPRWSWVRNSLAALIVLAAITSAVLRTLGPARTTSPAIGRVVSLDGVAVKGSRAAPVGLIEFADFQCPYCAVFARDTMPAIEQLYVITGSVRVAYRHLPLERIHPLAVRAAVLAECPGPGGDFWKMYDLFYRQRSLNVELVRELEQTGSRTPEAVACAASARGRIDRDVREARALGLGGTPAFAIGLLQDDGLRVERILVGNVGIAAFTIAIDELLARSGPGIAPAVERSAGR
jgi:protein-disulfide isomerase